MARGKTVSVPKDAPCCYILQCGDGSFYTGWTSDLERRLNQHNSGNGGSYTRSHRPVALVYAEPLPDSRAARRREAVIKRMSRMEKKALVAAARRRKRTGRRKSPGGAPAAAGRKSGSGRMPSG
jgi:putative endonuclease